MQYCKSRKLPPIEAEIVRDVLVRMGIFESPEAIAEELAREGVYVQPAEVRDLLVQVLDHAEWRPAASSL